MGGSGRRGIPRAGVGLWANSRQLKFAVASFQFAVSRLGTGN